MFICPKGVHLTTEFEHLVYSSSKACENFSTSESLNNDNQLIIEALVWSYMRTIGNNF